MPRYNTRFGQDVEYNIIDVKATDLGSGATAEAIRNVLNVRSWGLLIPETFTAATIKVYVSLGVGENGTTEKWLDATNAMFGAATLNTAGTYTTSTYLPHRIKVIYTSSNATNHGSVHLIRNGM